MKRLKRTQQEFPRRIQRTTCRTFRCSTRIGDVALYIDPGEFHRVDDGRILRYDLTLPLLLGVRYEEKPLRVWTSGKVYRAGQIDATHLEAFHQAEVLYVDEIVEARVA